MSIFESDYAMLRFTLPLCCALFTTSALAAPLSSLIAGGTLISDDMTASNFSFSDALASVGAPAVNVDAADIDVSLATSGDTVLLTLEFSTALYLTAPDELELLGGFDLSSSERSFTSFEIAMNGTQLTGDAAMEFAVSSPVLTTTQLSDGVSVLSNGGALGGSSTSFAWDLQGSVFGDNASVGLSSLTFGYVMDDALPEPSNVPLPAGLPLLLTALCAAGLIKSRSASRTS